jgi:hypothetical protein
MATFVGNLSLDVVAKLRIKLCLERTPTKQSGPPLMVLPLSGVQDQTDCLSESALD